MPRGRKNPPAPLRAKKNFSQREERFPPRREDHIAVLAGTWVDPNGSGRQESSMPSDEVQTHQDILQDDTTGGQSRYRQPTYSSTSQTTCHYKSESLDTEENSPTCAAGRQSFRTPSLDRPSTTPSRSRQGAYRYTARNLVGEKNIPAPRAVHKSYLESPVTTPSTKLARQHQDMPHSPPEQHVNKEPDTPPQKRPTQPTYQYTKETLEDSFQILPPSQDQQHSQGSDDDFEEFTVVRTIKQVYKVRVPVHASQKFGCAHENEERHYEECGQSAQRNTFARQYHGDESSSPQHPNPSFTFEGPDSWETGSSRPSQDSQPNSGDFHGWDEGLDGEPRYDQPQPDLNNDRRGRHFEDEFDPMDSGCYRRKRGYDDLEEDEYDSFFDTGVEHGPYKKKMKRHVF